MTLPRLRVATLLTTAAIALAACGGNAATPAPSATASPTPSASATPAPTPTATPTPEVTSTPAASGGSIGGERGRVTADGFAVTLADGWVSLPLDEAKLLEAIDNIPDDLLSAQLKAQVPTILASGMKMWAIDESTNGGANVNVLVIDQPVEMDVTTLKSVAGQGLTMIGAETTSVEEIDVDGSAGIKARYTLSSTSGGQTINMSGTQVYAQNAGKLYIFSFTDGLGNSGDDIDAMIEGIELLS